MRQYFFICSATIFISIFLIALFWTPILWVLALVIPFFLLGLYNLIQKKHTILRNFPLIAHFRYIFEAIRPEIQQYFIEPDWDGRPLNRLHRMLLLFKRKELHQ